MNTHAPSTDDAPTASFSSRQNFPTHRGFGIHRRLAAVILALLLGASACSNDTDDAADDVGGESPVATDGDFETEAAGGVAADGESMILAEETEDSAAAEQPLVAQDEMSESDEAVDEMPSDDDGFFDEDDERVEENNTFEDYGVRQFVSTSVDPISTFSLDVDTASYSLGRQWLSEGTLPPEESVRLEEYVNSFNYDYPAPDDGLGLVVAGGPSPFHDNNVMVSIGVQAETVADADRPGASLVFVVDTSGSMDRQNRLALVKTSLIRLVRELNPDDTVAIVTYSDGSEVILPPTSASAATEIIAAIDNLRTDGSTNLEAGLQAGYDLANEAFREDGINRVILASDGVANVGLTDPDGLVELIRGDADKGIQLVTVGVGMGNFNDVVMETLADDGDGFYAYVDTEAEADKLFGDELVSTLLTVAIDAKIQVQFDPEVIEAYRLLGYENRAVLDSDFRNDAVDAGELGAGHQVTAVYELTLVDGGRDSDSFSGDDLGTVYLRWEDPGTREVIETDLALDADSVASSWADSADDFRLAVTVAAFAEIMRGSPFAGDLSLEQVEAEAQDLAGSSASIAELVEMIDQAGRLR